MPAKKGGMVIASGKMALLWVVFAGISIASVYFSFWLALQGASILEALLAFTALVVTSAVVIIIAFDRMLKKSKSLGPGKMDEWVLLLTVLGAAFAVGGAFQSISNFSAQTISNSTCVSPSKTNVTSPNCAEIQTVSQTQGPFLYFGQIGVWMVVLGSIGAITFGIIYFILRAEIIATP